MTLEAGNTYLVNRYRGEISFVGKLISSDETWATFKMAGGRARALMDYSGRCDDEEITVRKSFCQFTEKPACK